MIKRIPAGEMRHLVTIREHEIEAASTALDSYGQISQSTTAWKARFKPRAKIEQLTGEEIEIARQVYPKASYRLTIDYIAVLASTGGSRRAVEFENRFLHIGAVIDPDMEKRQLQLLCGQEK